MPWKPEPWSEFVSTYRAGDCRVEFFRNTLEWASRAGWNLKPDLSKQRREAIQIFVVIGPILLAGWAFGAWSGLVPLIGLPVLAVLAQSHATTVNHADWEKAFINRMLSSENDFWDAWQSSGIDLYRRGRDGKWRF